MRTRCEALTFIRDPPRLYATFAYRHYRAKHFIEAVKQIDSCDAAVSYVPFKCKDSTWSAGAKGLMYWEWMCSVKGPHKARRRVCVCVCAHLFYCPISLCLLITLPALHRQLNASNSCASAGRRNCSCGRTLWQRADSCLSYIVLHFTSKAPRFIFTSFLPTV